MGSGFGSSSSTSGVIAERYDVSESLHELPHQPRRKVLWIVGILVVPLGLLVYSIWDAARPRTT
jgi:hypothetical protein